MATDSSGGFQPFDLVVIGSSNQDLVISVPHIPLAGETVLGGQSRLHFGGKGANQAVAAARTGGRVLFITRLGNDLFGRGMMDHFRREGLSEQGILVDPDEPTGLAQIWVSGRGENSIAVAPGANNHLLPSAIEPFIDLIKGTQVLLLQLEIPPETVQYAARIAAGAGVRVILNPAPARPLPDELLRQVWLLTPNESEAALLTGVEVEDIQTAQQAGALLLDRGVENVIITLGEKGSVLCNREGFRHFPAYLVPVVDTTAAGDVFNGSLAVAIAWGKGLAEAIPFSSAAAAVSVGRPGAQTSIPRLEEVEQFLNSI
ncbi:MAG: ribokinase [Bacteroidales bacterium]